MLYRLDPVGNRTGERTGTAGASLGPDGYALATGLTGDVTASFNRADWLLQRLDAVDSTKSVTFTYDLDGNQVSKQGTGLSRQFQWDIRNTLTAVLDGGQLVGSYDYDRELQRVHRDTASEHVQYVLDDHFVLEETSGGAGVRRYHYAKKPLAETEIGTASTQLYTDDALGSASDLVGTGGQLSSASEFDAWGNYRKGAPASGQPKLGYTGHQFDVETGLTYARARYYDSETGTFLSRDSLELGADRAPALGRYLYANINPLRFTDFAGTDYQQMLAESMRDEAYERMAHTQVGTPEHAAAAKQVAQWSQALQNARNQEDFDEHVAFPVVATATALSAAGAAIAEAGPAVATELAGVAIRASATAGRWYRAAVAAVATAGGGAAVGDKLSSLTATAVACIESGSVEGCAVAVGLHVAGSAGSSRTEEKQVVSQFVWKKEMAHSSGCLTSNPSPGRATTGGTRHGVTVTDNFACNDALFPTSFQETPGSEIADRGDGHRAFCGDVRPLAAVCPRRQEHLPLLARLARPWRRPPERARRAALLRRREAADGHRHGEGRHRERLHDERAGGEPLGLRLRRERQPQPSNRAAHRPVDAAAPGGGDTTYGYDQDDWLTGVQYPDKAVLYRLDAVGNRTGERSGNEAEQHGW